MRLTFLTQDDDGVPFDPPRLMVDDREILVNPSAQSVNGWEYRVPLVEDTGNLWRTCSACNGDSGKAVGDKWEWCEVCTTTASLTMGVVRVGEEPE